MKKQLRRAFTLIEMLVVIAIISILTAIIFPVFATVRENARQSSSLSNMHAISAALGQFQLDNHRNPDVLFGYVYHQYSDNSIVPMDMAYALAQSDAQMYNTDVSATFPGLYPEYVHDLASFRDPNNPSNGDNMAIASATINVLCPSTAVTCAAGDNGVLKAKPDTQFYAADAYDISPQVTSTNKLDVTTYVPRYQSSWTSVDNTLIGSADYTHQMRWKNPPADTYVTSTTYHVPNANTVLVLWEDGSVRKLNVDQFRAQDSGQDAPMGIGVTGTPAISQAKFWQLTPAQ